MRLDDGDAWRLINIVFWGMLLLVATRLALALMDDLDTAWLQSPDSQLPCEFEGGNILGMGRDPTKNQTPDLFSTERLGGPSSDRPADDLEDQELDRLLRAVTEETKRRGRPMPMAEASPTNTPAVSSEPIPKQTKSTGRPTRQRQVGVAAAALTKGQVNAVRAAFKAGVTPARIARHFGISQSNVRKALATISQSGEGTQAADTDTVQSDLKPSIFASQASSGR
jgi:hypothetical protein